MLSILAQSMMIASRTELFPTRMSEAELERRRRDERFWQGRRSGTWDRK